MRFVMDARYAGPQASGIGSYVRAIGARLPELARQAHFHFWVPPAALPLSHAPNASHATVRFRPTGISTLLFPSLLDTLRATDVFHGPANILGFGLPCPSVVTVHDVMWIEHLDWCQPRPWLRPISGPYFATGIRRALRHADCLLTLSKASADAIVRLEPSAHQRVFVTPNACEPHFRPAASCDARRLSVSARMRRSSWSSVRISLPKPMRPRCVRLRPPTSGRIVWCWFSAWIQGVAWSRWRENWVSRIA